jgi:hypothetical protein
MKMSKYTTCLYQVAAWTLIVEITFLQPVRAASDCSTSVARTFRKSQHTAN